MFWRESTDNSQNEICMQGFLKKSPPMELLAKQSSWKKRYFLLVRMTNKAYSLKYYTSPPNQQYKGEIRLEDVKSPCYGIEDRERISVVQKMFGYSPELVICLRKEKRDYYLLGDSVAQVDEWFDALSRAWKEVWMDAEPKLVHSVIPATSLLLAGKHHQVTSPKPCPTRVVPGIGRSEHITQTCNAMSSRTQETRFRSTSCPGVRTTEVVDNIEEETQGAASRPHSDPIPFIGSTIPRPFPPQLCTMESVESKRLSEESTSTDEGGVYDVPNPNLKCVFCAGDDSAAIEALRNLQCVHCRRKSNRVCAVPADMPQYEDSDNIEEDEDDEECIGTYEIMDAIRQSFHTYENIPCTRSLADSVDHPGVTDECDGKAESEMTGCLPDTPPLSSPGLEEESMSEASTQIESQLTGGALSRQRGSLELTGGKKKKITPSPSLTHGRLLRWFGIRDQSEFKELNISLPKEAASTHMGLLEVEDKICVSKWNGPENLGYPFHFGDHILAVNDIGVESRDDVLKTMSMVRSENVKITVLRVHNSVILNTK